MKTQLRFGNRDIEIFVKYRGDNTPFKKIKISDITDPDLVPSFDHSIHWKRHQDRPPRRTLRKPSGQAEPGDGHPATRKNTLRRQHSDTKSVQNKKTKMDSSSSDDDSSSSDPDQGMSDTPGIGKDTDQDQEMTDANTKEPETTQ